MNQFTSAMTLPKQIAYSEPRLQPPGGYKDTTVPGIFSRDTLFSHGNHEPGWVTAPGMQGVDVQPFTANMLTPESLAELMGGPDAPIPPGAAGLRCAAGRQPARSAERLQREQPAAAAVVPAAGTAAWSRTGRDTGRSGWCDVRAAGPGPGPPPRLDPRLRDRRYPLRQVDKHAQVV